MVFSSGRVVSGILHFVFLSVQFSWWEILRAVSAKRVGWWKCGKADGQVLLQIVNAKVWWWDRGFHLKHLDRCCA